MTIRRLAAVKLALAGACTWSACGGSTGFGGEGSATQRGTSATGENPAKIGSTEDSGSGSPGADTDPPSSERPDAGKPIVTDDENAPATEPAQVSGAFLVDCAWREDDAGNQRGIAGCSVVAKDENRALTAAEVAVESLKIATDAAAVRVSPLAGTDALPIRFPVDYAYYGQKVGLSLRLKLLAAVGGLPIDQVIDVEDIDVTSLPKEPPPATAQYETGAFKLGDDPFGKAVECREIEAKGSEKTTGRMLELSFDVESTGGNFTVAFERVCGNGSGRDGSRKPLRWEIIDSSGIPHASADVRESREASGMKDAESDAPTSSVIATAEDLRQGSYTLRVYAGEGSEGRLDDSVTENLRIKGPGFVFKSITFKD